MTTFQLNADPITFDILKKHFPDDWRIKTMNANIRDGFDMNGTYMTKTDAFSEKYKADNLIRSTIACEEFLCYETAGLLPTDDMTLEKSMQNLTDKRDAWQKCKEGRPELVVLERERNVRLAENNIKWMPIITACERAEGYKHHLNVLRGLYAKLMHSENEVCSGCVKLAI